MIVRYELVAGVCGLGTAPTLAEEIRVNMQAPGRTVGQVTDLKEPKQPLESPGGSHADVVLETWTQTTWTARSPELSNREG